MLPRLPRESGGTFHDASKLRGVAAPPGVLLLSPGWSGAGYDPAPVRLFALRRARPAKRPSPLLMPRSGSPTDARIVRHALSLLDNPNGPRVEQRLSPAGV